MGVLGVFKLSLKLKLKSLSIEQHHFDLVLVFISFHSRLHIGCTAFYFLALVMRSFYRFDCPTHPDHLTTPSTLSPWIILSTTANICVRNSLHMLCLLHNKCCIFNRYYLKGSSTMALCLETPAPPLETQWCCASKPQVRRASKPLGDKFWDQNFQVSVVFRPLRPKRAIPHPITIQNMRFRR